MRYSFILFAAMLLLGSGMYAQQKQDTALHTALRNF